VTIWGSDEDEFLPLGLTISVLGCGVGTLRRFLLRRFGGFEREARLIAQLIISSRLVREIWVAWGPQDNTWWCRRGVGSITASAEFSSTPTTGYTVSPRLWAAPT